jgi:hypothetical protein
MPTAASGVAAVALVGAAFYALRRIPSFLMAAGAVVAVFAGVTHPFVPARRLPEWYVMTAGLLAWAGGLAIVRLMLIRSASLQLLARIDGRHPGSFRSDMRVRLDELRAFRLVRCAGGANELTRFGAVLAGSIAVLYAGLRIER